jgi:AcrR family transcriptional regulator
LAELSAPVARGPYRNGVKRREQIVESAAEAFAEFGYSGASIRTIAGRVGISPATLIQHFGSKEGLLEAVLEDWTKTALPIPADTRGLAYFNALRELMDFHLAHRGLVELFLTMATEASSPVHPARAFIRRRYARGFDEFVKHLREARDLGEIRLGEEDIEHEARALMALMDGLELQWLIEPSVDLRRLFNRCMDDTALRWTATSGR